MAQVPATSYTTVAPGGVTTFSIPFDFLSRADVFVTVDGVTPAFTWINDGMIDISPAPAAGKVVTRYRSTPAESTLHVFEGGVPFTPRFIDENNNQLLYVVQEAVNTSKYAEAQVDGAVAAADAAVVTADAAVVTADAAEATAAAATMAADAATAASASATSTANTALANSTAAVSTANTANTTANSALVAAGAALDLINDAVSGSVASFAGRAGTVVPISGDYSAFYPLRAELGTAAAANTTTSRTDTTAGRLLKAGDFGVGYNAGGGLIDFNTVVWTSFFHADGTESQGAALNWPSTGLAGTTPVWFNLQTSSDETNNRISQIATECYGTVPGVRQWIRTKHDAGWEPWVEVWTTSNLVKTASATDTTAGRMLKVGDFGVGAPIPTTNLNTLTGTGLFSCGDVTGTPSASYLGWWVYQIDAGPGLWKNQTAWQQSNPQAQYVRASGSGATWGAWSRVIFADSPVFAGTPSGPTAAPGTNTTQFATTAFVLANQSGLGIGQTWQNVLGSRALGTTYTNSTGKPIEVAVSTASSSNTSSIAVTVAGVLIINDASASGTSGHATFIVPAGATYSVASGKTLNRWAELR